MGEVSGYSLELYCDNVGPHAHREFPHCYFHQLRGPCVKAARKHGWVFHKNGKLSCPKCRTLPQPEGEFNGTSNDA